MRIPWHTNNSRGGIRHTILPRRAVEPDDRQFSCADPEGNRYPVTLNKHSIVVAAVLLALSCLPCCVSVADAAPMVRLRKIAVSGDPIPGVEPANTFNAFGNPNVNGQGDVVFLANDNGTNTGIWFHDGNRLAPIVLDGWDAPGTGASFVRRGGLLPSGLPLNDAGHTIFYAALTDGRLGLWLGSVDRLQLISLARDPAPGVNEGRFFGFDHPRVSISAAGTTLFRAVLNGTQVTAENNHGLWTGGVDGLTLVAREGDRAPTAANAYFGEFIAPLASIDWRDINANGQITFLTDLTVPNAMPGDPHSGIFSNRLGSIAPVALSGWQAPDEVDDVRFEYFYHPALGDSGHVAFVSTLLGEVAGTNSGIYSDRGGRLAKIFREGSHAPGTDNETTFRAFGTSIAMNSRDQLAFMGRLQGPSVTTSNDSGVWVEGPDGFRLVAREGDLASGAPDGVRFASIEPGGGAALNESGEALFRAQLTDATGAPSNQYGVWTEIRDKVELVAHAGQLLEVRPGIYKEISSIGYVAPSTSSVNIKGLLRIGFSDESSGLYLIMRVPEPCGLTYLIVAQLFLMPMLRRRRATVLAGSSPLR